MPIVTAAGRGLEVDWEGFLRDPAGWDEGAAVALAETEGIEVLTEEHWRIIRFLRQYYEETGRAPTLATVRRECGIADVKEIWDLFPSGPAVGAARLAGLPKPCGCL